MGRPPYRLTQLLRRGLARVRSHGWLLLLVYLVPLLTALLPVLSAAMLSAGELDSSLMSDRILEGQWIGVVKDLLASRDGRSPLPDAAVRSLVLVSILLQVLVSAVIIEVLGDHPDVNHGPSFAGVARSFVRFLRSLLWFLAALAPVLLAAASLQLIFEQLATELRDGRLDLVGAGLAGGLLLLVFVPLDLAYDLSRIASARHDDGSTLLGLYRAIIVVLRSPRLLLPVYGVLAIPLVLLSFGYLLLLSAWTPASAAAVVLLLLVQQSFMLARTLLRLWCWGTEIECYRLLGEPRWCLPLRKTAPPCLPPAQALPPVVSIADPSPEPERPSVPVFLESSSSNSSSSDSFE